MKHALARRCSDCPKRTKAVCHLAFGVFWCIKSGDGEGCDHPLDGVAEAWGKCRTDSMSVVESPKLATHGNARAKIPSVKTSFVQLELTAATDKPPLSDSDY